LTELYAWLEIAWDDGPLHHFLNQRYHPTRHPLEKEPLELKTFEHTRTERWKFWSDAQRTTFEEICGQAMAGFGYAIPWQAAA
jgi:hypothetical protein